MEQDVDREGLLREAEQRERERRWSEAASLYEQSSKLLYPSSALAAASLRRAGLCLNRAAFESATRQEFEERILAARDKWSRATSLLRDASDGKQLLESFQNHALIKRADAQLAGDSKQRREVLEECCTNWTKALQQAYDSIEVQSSADILSELADTLLDLCELEADWRTREKLMEQAITYGRLALSAYSKLGENKGLARAYRLVAAHCERGGFLASSQSKKERYRRNALEFSSKAVEYATKTEEPIELGLSLALLSLVTNDFTGDSRAALEIASKAVQTSDTSKDHLLRAIVLAQWCEAALLSRVREEDPAKKSELAEKCLVYADQARQHLWIIKAELSPLASEALINGIVEPNWNLATEVETSLQQKKTRLDSALKIGKEAVTIARLSQSAVSIMSALHSLSKVEYSLALLEPETEEKRRRLESALEHREEEISCMESSLPHAPWIGISLSHLAGIQLELAQTEQDKERSQMLLGEAAENGRRSLPYLRDYLVSSPALGYHYERLGIILNQLYPANRNEKTLQESVTMLEEAAKAYKDGEMPGRAAEAFWQLAKSLDAAGRFSDASRAYREASACYRLAAEKYRLAVKKIPGLSSMFEELAYYMDAWTEIEDAKLRHNEEQFSLAAKKYTKAASILQATRTWSHLSRQYIACSLLERGEALSRQERQVASLESFSNAVKVFRGARAELEDRLRAAAESQVKQELKDWLKVTSGKERYCLGRAKLEEAKVLDRKGEKSPSSTKYLSASEVFRALLAEARSEQERGEMQTLTLFCDSWAKMKEAEAEASPELYAEAAELFMEAKEAATKKFRLLALANAAICKALESGTLFRLTQNTQLYSEVKKQMQTAADYYQEAGFENAAEWARATQRMFDALVYLANAEIDVDPKRKTELYHLAEKHLELAARLYGEAGFPSKKKEALKHLERAREEKEVLLTPVEALAENPAVAGVAVAPVSLNRDQALGLERFEAASVVGNLSVPQRELNVGADLTLELEFANVGRTAATLIKLENMAPEGFEFDSQRNLYRLEGDFINLKGKRLEYLETHEVRVALKALRKGTFELRPELLFVDEKGNYRSYEFEPTTLTITELGIAGWIKGPSKLGVPSKPQGLPFKPATPLTRVLSEFRFETERSRDVFQLLVKEFREDYMSKRLYVEKAGWRSLMDLIRDLKMPRSALYGPGGRNGPVLAELERRGLVETRVFPEERGRGGTITKVRVAYDNAIVRRLVEQAVMESS